MNKIDFQPKDIKKDKEGHSILMKVKIYQDELSITTNGETQVFHDKTKFTKTSFHKSSPSKDNKWNTSTQEGKLHARKRKKVIFQQT